MALIKSVNQILPIIGSDGWLAETAVIVGDVVLGTHCTVWFGAVVRGDVNEIRIGNHTNIQDQAVIHCTYQKSGTYIGNHVSIGHGAIVHGCTIEDNVLIGMGAIVMDNAVIGAGSVIGAGAIVTQGQIVPPNSVMVGSPARFLKNADEKMQEMISRTARNYPMYASWYEEEKSARE